MTKLSPSGLETFDYGMPYWNHIYNRNIDLLNGDLLKMLSLGDVRARYMQDGMVLVYDEPAERWTGRFFPHKLNDGQTYFADDHFPGTSLNANRWRIVDGTPTVSGSHVILSRTSGGGGTEDKIRSKWSIDSSGGDDRHWDIYIKYDVSGNPATNDWYLMFRVDNLGGNYKMAGPGYYSGGKVFRYFDGSGLSEVKDRTNDRGYLKISRYNHNIYVHYRDGFKDRQWRFLGSYTYSNSIDYFELYAYGAVGYPACTVKVDQIKIARLRRSVFESTTTTSTTTTTTTTTSV